MRRPLAIAHHARNAHGLLGRLIASIMVKETGAANIRAIAALDVRPDDHVLDIGCGSGRSLELLLDKITSGHVSGVDPSTLMADRATYAVRAAIKARKADVKIAAVEQLPYADARFDKVMSVHTAYFWDRLDVAFAEIARVMKPRAHLVLILRTDADQAATRSFPAEVYTFRPIGEIVAGLASVGLVLDRVEGETESAVPALLVAHRG